MRLLVADDDPVSRRLIESALTQCGHDVVAAGNGAEAWRRFQESEFPLVISDWMMPEMDGMELLRRVRSYPRSGYVYFIMLTAKTQKQDVIRGIEAGADDFITKPFDQDELRARLRTGERIIRLEQDLARRNEDLEAINVALARANERMRVDLEAAALLQRHLLPTDSPDAGRAMFAWRLKPCPTLAGDFLNVYRLNEHNVGFYLLDVCGHGVAATLQSATLSRLLSPVPDQSSLVRKMLKFSPDYFIVPPNQVAEQLNRWFIKDTGQSRHFTLLYGILDMDTHDLRYVCAGHPAPAYLPCDPAGAGACLLDDGAWPIGVADEPTYEEHALQLNTGDRLFLYSDGVVDAMDTRSERFGSDRLITTLRETSQRPLRDSVTTLLGCVDAWRGDAELMDDLSVLALEIR